MKIFNHLGGAFRLLVLAAALFLFALPANAYIMDDLSGYWTFDQNFGDYSTYKTPTTSDWSGGVPTSVGPCMVDSCYEFCTAGGVCAGGSAATDNTVPDLAGDSFSIAGWFLNRAADSNGWPVLYRWVGDYYVGINTDNNNITASYKPNNSVSIVLDPSYAMVTDTWYHVAVVFDDTTDMISLYINGVLEDQAAVSDSSVAGAVEALYFAEDPTYSTMSGQIDEVAIWKRALTEDDLDFLYNDGIGRELPIVIDRYEWNFEDEYKRSLVVTPNALLYSPDYGVGSISLTGGQVFTAWNTGYSGGYAPNSNTWDSGMDTKYWRIRIPSTFGLENVRISSRQRSSATGPRDFKLQYSVSGRLPLLWVDVPGGTITNANNFTTGVLTDLDLPDECDSSYVLYLRWIMASDTSVGGGVVGAAGTSRIDNIVLEGDIIHYDLDYSAGAGGSLIGVTAQNVPYRGAGTSVTAVPDVNYHFVDWSDGVLTAERRDVNVTDNLTVTANFALDTYTLTYSTDGNGTISGTAVQTIAHGSDGTSVTAIANTGYKFVDWSDGVTTDTRTDLNVTGDITVTANFRKLSAPVIYIPVGTGTGAVDQAIPMYETKAVGRLDQSGINILSYLNGQANFEAKESRSRLLAWHHIKILNIDMTEQIVKIEVASAPQYFTMNLEEEIQVDLDGDQIKDISIKYEDLQVNRVELTVKSLLTDDLASVVTVPAEPIVSVPSTEAKTCPGNFNRNLEQGMSGMDVKALQQYLNAQGFVLAVSGPGAPGNETEYFGSLTKAALERYQKSKGIVTTYGEFDEITRAYLGCVGSGVSVVPVTPSIGKYVFTRSLQLGMTGADVKELQKFLNNNGFAVATEGPGSLGNETEMFGSLTKQALIKYQLNQGIMPASGYFGDWTRWWVNKQ